MNLFSKLVSKKESLVSPTHMLNPTINDLIIESCAAPGNKTTHVASYILFNQIDNHTHGWSRVQINAFETDPERTTILEIMIKIAVCHYSTSIKVGNFSTLVIPNKIFDERVVIGLLLDEDIKNVGWKVVSRDFIIPNWRRRGIVEKFKDVFGDSVSVEECEIMVNGCIKVTPRVDDGIYVLCHLFCTLFVECLYKYTIYIERDQIDGLMTMHQ